MANLIKVVVLLLCSINAYASPKTGEVLQNFVNQLKTFEADFEQVQPEEELFKLNKSVGAFKLKRPGRLLWSYQKPQPQQIMIDGKNLWVYDEDLDQVTVRGVDEVQNDLPLSWLLFDEPIEARYQIIYGGLMKGVEWFNLEPKEHTYFQSLDIGMKDGVMVEVHMYQSSDNVTKVRFKNIKVNQPMADAQFQFQIPAGVDLIGRPK